MSGRSRGRVRQPVARRDELGFKPSTTEAGEPDAAAGIQRGSCYWHTHPELSSADDDDVQGRRVRFEPGRPVFHRWRNRDLPGDRVLGRRCACGRGCQHPSPPASKEHEVDVGQGCLRIGGDRSRRSPTPRADAAVRVGATTVEQPTGDNQSLASAQSSLWGRSGVRLDRRPDAKHRTRTARRRTIGQTETQREGDDGQDSERHSTPSERLSATEVAHDRHGGRIPRQRQECYRNRHAVGTHRFSRIGVTCLHRPPRPPVAYWLPIRRS